MSHTMVDQAVDVCYSPDEGSWYLQRFDSGHESQTSQPFRSQQAALEAYRLWRAGIRTMLSNRKAIRWS